MQALIIISALSALLMLAPAAGDTARGGLRWGLVVALVLATGAAGVLARNIPAVPGILVAYGRYAATWVGLTNIIYVGEGLNAFVAVSETSTACGTTTTPARCKHRASRRTCVCSACLATSRT